MSSAKQANFEARLTSHVAGVTAVLLGITVYLGWSNRRVQSDFPAITYGRDSTNTNRGNWTTVDLRPYHGAETTTCDFVVNARLYSSRYRTDSPKWDKEVFVRYQPSDPDMNYIAEQDVASPGLFFAVGAAVVIIVALTLLALRRWRAVLACLLAALVGSGAGVVIANWTSDRRVIRINEYRELIRQTEAQSDADGPGTAAGRRFMREDSLREFRDWENHRRVQSAERPK